MQEIPADVTKVVIDGRYYCAAAPCLVYLNEKENRLYYNSNDYHHGVDLVITMERVDDSWNVSTSTGGEADETIVTVPAGDSNVLYLGNGKENSEYGLFYIVRLKITAE